MQYYSSFHTLSKQDISRLDYDSKQPCPVPKIFVELYLKFCPFSNVVNIRLRISQLLSRATINSEA